jgi:hypothetical protein
MIISRIKYFKFSILCNNDTEWCDIQKELFKLGYKWKSCGQEIRFSSWKYPLIIKNYRNDDEIGSEILVEDSFYIQTNKEKFEFINAKNYLRKQKIQKLNENIQI